MSRPDEVELAVRTPLPSPSSTLAPETTHERSLPPTDRANSPSLMLMPQPISFPCGKLAASFFVEAIVWGFPNAYGVFLDSYLQDPRFGNQDAATTLLPLVGTLSSGIIYCSGVVFNPISARFPQHRRKAMWAGAVACCLSLFGASYARTITELVAVQGILYAIGGAVLYLSCLSFMSEWFVVKRGTANGILFAGTAAGGLLLPLTLPHLIAKFGTPKTLRILSITIGVLLALLLPFVKGRVPQTRTVIRGPAPRGLRDWFRRREFWVFLTVNTLQGLAYFVPILYLPTFANNLNISASNSAVALAMLNGASLVGRLSMGYLSDKFNFWLLALATLFTTSVATFVLWGVLSSSFAGLLGFGIAYGSVAGGWTCLWAGLVRRLAQDDATTSTALYGYLLFSRGFGNIVSTPISARLYAQAHSNSTSELLHHPTGFAVDEGRFRTMIVYVGTCFAGAALVAALGWGMEGMQRRQARSRSGPRT
ncbi:hypothetical protein HMN09_00981800 [Mycena chlorophos]|uniref:MFS general substrate transporter n=1 Tax=Mycena chlorophos TaxID=658473 RepID=A0A8H6VZC4_MYCCL|nr:hypothetical protein HMN09_00981800 [Mycena chlorophos]